MAQVYPFSAIIPSASKASKIATLPYDVMNREEARRMATSSDSFLHVTRAEIDLPDEVSPYDPKVYETAARNWRQLRDRRMAKDAVPAYYVYSLVMDGRRQTGIVATPAVEDYDRQVILKHEKTRRDKEDDRTNHIQALRAQTGPVFLTYPDCPELDAIVAETMKGTPLFEFTAEDGISHTGWRVKDEATAAVQEAFAKIPKLYIADGHHRAASASRVNATLQGDGDSGRFLAVIFPASQLRILAYNRLIMDLNGLSEQEFMNAIGKIAPLTETASPVPEQPGFACLYCQGKWWSMALPAPSVPNAIDDLDVSRLQNAILSPLLGIDDPRTSKRLDFVGGIRGTGELERRVNSGEAKAAFSMYPTTLAQLMNIADQGQIMPPKSTWFEPKLRDGLFVHEI